MNDAGRNRFLVSWLELAIGKVSRVIPMNTDKYYDTSKCQLCNTPKERVIAEDDLAFAIPEFFPVTEGHTLIVPRRHLLRYFELSLAELRSVHKLVIECSNRLDAYDETIDGYNIGSNVGISAGQIGFHTHVHLIPRRTGDIHNPRGGVRGVIPNKQDY